MSNVETAALTILIGVAVYVLGRIIERAFIEPLNDYRRLVVDTAGTLAMHAYYWGETTSGFLLSASNGDDASWRGELRNVTDEAARDVRAKGAQLGAYAVTLPWYPLWSLLYLMPKRSDLLKASNELAGMANRMPAINQEDVQANEEASRAIQKLLRMART